jgi:GTPase SAR1 family protein
VIEGSLIPFILCGNKVDLINEAEMNGEDLHELQTEEGLEKFA